MTPDTGWALRLPAPLDEVRALTDELHVHPVLASAVWARGLGERASLRLAPSLTPAPIPALDDAAARLATAVERRERILLHGDYDADGVTGTALLTLGLRALGADVTPYVPDRLTDGYGVSGHRLAEHAARADLFVTIDCGITNLAEVAGLRGAGVDVIVTDHHLPGDTLPAAIVVHPALTGADDEGTADLTGAGVAYHLLWALHRRLGLEPPLHVADLAAVGTIADVAPLLGANRALVREGLARLRHSSWAGLRALVSLNKLRGDVSAQHVAFVIAPRLNAAGRLGRADDALELLTTGSDDRARVLATLLDVHNGERRATQERMLGQALELVDEGAPAVVLRHDDWHPGVMGIVASKILERHYRPVYVVARGKGSVRSTPGISAVGGLRAASAWLTRWGGHAAAAGFALEDENFERFRDAIYEYVAGHEPPVRTVTADALLRPEQVTPDLHAALAALEPYGQGHPAPHFAVRGTLTRIRAVGNGGSHLQLRIGGIKGVAWNRGHEAASWRPGATVTAFASLAESTYRDTTTIEMRAEGLTGATGLRLLADGARTRAGGGAPAGSVAAGARGPRLVVGPPDRHGPGTRHVTSLEPRRFDPLAELREALATGDTVHLDLGASALEALLEAAAEYPVVHDVRIAFVQTQRGRPWPWSSGKVAIVRTVLEELDLLDDRGLARSRQRRDPYDSPTLRAALVARHALETTANLLLALEPDDAAVALLSLLGPVGGHAVEVGAQAPVGAAATRGP